MVYGNVPQPTVTLRTFAMPRRTAPQIDPELRGPIDGERGTEGNRWAEKPATKRGTDTPWHKRRYFRYIAEKQANEIAARLFQLTLLRRWEYAPDIADQPNIEDVEALFAYLKEEIKHAETALKDRRTIHVYRWFSEAGKWPHMPGPTAPKKPPRPRGRSNVVKLSSAR